MVQRFKLGNGWIEITVESVKKLSKFDLLKIGATCGKLNVEIYHVEHDIEEDGTHVYKFRGEEI